MGGRTSCCTSLTNLALLGEGASETGVRGEGVGKEVDSTSRQCFAWQHEVAIHHITACLRYRQPADVGKTDFAWCCCLAIVLLQLQPAPPPPRCALGAMLQVVQPLVHVVDTAHADVNQILAHFNQPVRLPPLPEVIGASSSLGGVGGDRQPSVGDIEAMVRYVQGFCQALSQQAAQQNNALLLAKVREPGGTGGGRAGLLGVMGRSARGKVEGAWVGRWMHGGEGQDGHVESSVQSLVFVSSMAGVGRPHQAVRRHRLCRTCARRAPLRTCRHLGMPAQRAREPLP